MLPRKPDKAQRELPQKVRETLWALVAMMRELGPAQPKFPNYGKLKGSKNMYHCHLQKGKPTYVAVWEVRDKQIRLIEVIYVGTHENAPY